jgi:ribosomal protein S27AE
MRTYRKRASQSRTCVHSGESFESNHKRRIYCGNSCSTLAYYARKKQGLPPAEVSLTPSASEAAVLSAPPTEAAPVTLALNMTNVSLLTASSLLADGLKRGAQLVGEWLTPPPIGPSTWLPAIFRLVKQPLVSCQFPGWDEPRFFVPVPWQGELFYYRASEDLLFWQAPDGLCHQLTQQAQFEQLTARLRLQKLVQRYVPDYSATNLPKLPKNLG